MIQNWLRRQVSFGNDWKFKGKIRRIIGFSPGEGRLYRLALRHSSMVRNRDTSARECNERLEFLGDAVLGVVVAEHLYKLYPLRDEGFLTEMRSKIVNRNTLSDLAKKMGIPELMEFDTKVMGAFSSPRSLGGDALEALIGAIYLDKGFLFARKFVLEKLLARHLTMKELEALQFNAKSKLMEYAQRQKWEPIEYFTTEEKDGNRKVYKVIVMSGEKSLGTATDIKKKTAEQKASEVALLSLGVL